MSEVGELNNMKAEDRARIEKIRQVTGHRLGLKEWETITAFHVLDGAVMVTVETYEVKDLVRETQYLKKGNRWLIYSQGPHGWYLDTDMTAWDENYTPVIFDKTGRRKSAEEEAEQREWEKLCYRPGSGRTPLDSYTRVLDGCYSDSEKKMEGYF